MKNTKSLFWRNFIILGIILPFTSDLIVWLVKGHYDIFRTLKDFVSYIGTMLKYSPLYFLLVPLFNVLPFFCIASNSRELIRKTSNDDIFFQRQCGIWGAIILVVAFDIFINVTLSIGYYNEEHGIHQPGISTSGLAYYLFWLASLILWYIGYPFGWIISKFIYKYKKKT